jgi:hypothetical protein
MKQRPEISKLGLVAGSLLLLATACQERTPDNPDPKHPPLKITVTGPEGSVEGDSTQFEAIMRGDAVPIPRTYRR